jgi:hypothetical protein
VQRAWFTLAVVVIVLVVLGGLYVTGPKYVGPYVCMDYRTVPGGGGPFGGDTQDCVEYRRRDRANAWERISGALTG